MLFHFVVVIITATLKVKGDEEEEMEYFQCTLNHMIARLQKKEDENKKNETSSINEQINKIYIRTFA